MSLAAAAALSARGWIIVYTLRMNVVPMTSGEQRLVHGVGLAWTFL
jgi:hypothetical protein